MENAFSKKILISCIIIVIIIIIIIIAILLNRKSNDKQLSIENEGGTPPLYGYILDENISREAYFDINNCMNKYLGYLNIKNDLYFGYNQNGIYIQTVKDSIIQEKIYDSLSDNYIRENNITIQNVYSYVKTLDRKCIYVPLEAKVIQDDTIKSFLVHGLVEDIQYNVIQEIFAVININFDAAKYSIKPIQDKYNSINEIQIDYIETKINDNKYNRFTPSAPNYKDEASDFINLFKALALGKPEELYYKLEDKYRNAKFKNIDDFKIYINAKREEISKIVFKDYEVKKTEEYTQFVCLDKNMNNYIFRVKSPFNYSIILDTYTIDLLEFLEKYNSTTDQGKVVLNINKFMLALNDGDYQYAYNKLADGFKANNFPTLASFEEYVKNNFFAKNKFDYKKFGKEGEKYYTYSIDITDMSGTLENTINKTFIMQLGEGTDFKLSFNK